MNVLILGGVGFIGRNLVKYLVDHQPDTNIKVLDKVLLATSFLSAEHKAAFDSPNVTVKQANLSSPKSIEANFEGKPWDVVVNLAAETKFGQTEEVYKEKVLDVAVKCAAEAKKIGCRKWIEVSTAQVYQAAKGKKPSTEESPLEPWTKLAKYKLGVEEHLKGTGLDYSVIRAAIVHGPGDVSGLAPRIIIGAVYKKLNDKQKNLWTAGLSLNTVHVEDVCCAIVESMKWPSGATYNLVDENKTDQGTINKHLEELFGIKTGFYGAMASKVAETLALSALAAEANDKHLKPWSDLCREQGIASTPLSPYIDQELLSNNNLFVSGEAIKKTGFKYAHPKLSTDDFRVIMEYYQKQGLFPQ